MMKKFLRNLILFTLVLLVFDRALFLFFQSQRPNDYKLFLSSKKSYFDNDQQFDLLIIGDSHVADAVSPRVLEEEFKIKSFNLGIYLSSPYEYY